VRKSISLAAGREFDLIREFLRDAPVPEDLLLPPGDDCVVLSNGTALSADLSVEGVHFRRDWISFEDIGYRAATAALSDLAAVAAQPIGTLISIAAPVQFADDTIVLMRSARAAADRIGAVLLGGDLTRATDSIAIDVVAIGHTMTPIPRSGARAGDSVWVTGVLGGAATAVEQWLCGATPTAAAREAYARPTARTAEARWLADHADITALIDISDGLAGDAAHIAAASKVGILLDVRALPLHPAALAEPRALALALNGGEDYELCFTTKQKDMSAVVEAFEKRFGCRLTRVGEVVDGEGVLLRDDGALRPALGGFQHFQERPQ